MSKVPGSFFVFLVGVESLWLGLRGLWLGLGLLVRVEGYA